MSFTPLKIFLKDCTKVHYIFFLNSLQYKKKDEKGVFPDFTENPTSKEDCFMKILLVDDNPIYLEGLKNLLEAGGTEICTAQNGREALEKAACFAPDAV